MLYMALCLQPDPDLPQMLNDGDNYNEFMPTKAKYFARGGSVYAIIINLVFGIDRSSPLNKDGTNPSDQYDYGTVNYDPNYRLHKSAACMLRLCELAAVKNSDRGTGGEPEYYHTCWPRAMQAYVTANTVTDGGGNALTWTDMVGDADLPANETAFNLGFAAWFDSSSSVYDTYKPYLWAEYVDIPNDACYEAAYNYSVPSSRAPDGKCTLVRMTYSRLSLNVDFNILFSDVIDVANAWETWESTALDDPICSTQADKLAASPMYVSSSMLY